MPYAEIIFISAKSGQRLNKIFELIDVVIANNSMRVATGVLNEIVTEAVAMQQPPSGPRENVCASTIRRRLR